MLGLLLRLSSLTISISQPRRLYEYSRCSSVLCAVAIDYYVWPVGIAWWLFAPNLGRSVVAFLAAVLGCQDALHNPSALEWVEAQKQSKRSAMGSLISEFLSVRVVPADPAWVVRQEVILPEGKGKILELRTKEQGMDARSYTGFKLKLAYGDLPMSSRVRLLTLIILLISTHLCQTMSRDPSSRAWLRAVLSLLDRSCCRWNAYEPWRVTSVIRSMLWRRERTQQSGRS